MKIIDNTDRKNIRSHISTYNQCNTWLGCLTLLVALHNRVYRFTLKTRHQKLLSRNGTGGGVGHDIPVCH